MLQSFSRHALGGGAGQEAEGNLIYRFLWISTKRFIIESPAAEAEVTGDFHLSSLLEGFPGTFPPGAEST